MCLHEKMQEPWVLRAPRDTGGLPYPPGEGDKEAGDRQLGLGILEGIECWECCYGYKD